MERMIGYDGQHSSMDEKTRVAAGFSICSHERTSFVDNPDCIPLLAFWQVIACLPKPCYTIVTHKTTPEGTGNARRGLRPKGGHPYER